MTTRPTFSNTVILAVYVLLFGVMTIGAVWLNQTYLESLNFHTKDFAYYLQFGLKWLDSRYTPQMSINPNGINFLGFYGPEATTTIHQAIHFEPFKYIDGIFLILFRAPLALFVLRSALFFAPILYLGWGWYHAHRRNSGIVFTFLLALCALPSMPFAVTHDLRPFQLLAPFLLLSLIAITVRRPSWEILLWFNALFLVREEALVFGAGLIVYALASEIATSMPSKLPIKGMVLSGIFWGVMTAIYFWFMGYPSKGLGATRVIVEGEPFNPLSLVPLGLLGGLFLGVLGWGWLRKQKSVLPLAALIILVLPMAWQFYGTYNTTTTDILIPDALFSPRLYLMGALFLFLGFLAGAHAQARWVPRLVTTLLGVIAVVGITITTFHPESGWAASQEALRRQDEVEVVWKVQSLTNPLETSVLTDKWGYQAFYNYESVMMYESLPYYVHPHPMQEYPENLPALVRALDDVVDVIVITKESRTDIESALSTSGMASRVLLVEQNDRFIVYQIARPTHPIVSHHPVADFGGQIRLAMVEIQPAVVHPNETVKIILSLQRIVPITQDYNVLVKLVDAQGQEIARSEGYPWGAPTSQWQAWEIRPDGHDLQIPSHTSPGDYNITVEFYDPATFAPLTVSGVNDPETVLSDREWQVGQVTVTP